MSRRPPRRAGQERSSRGAGDPRSPAVRGPDRAPRGRPSADVLFGRNPVREALRARRRRVREVWATAAAAREPWLAGVPHAVVEAEEVEQRAGTDAHQGVCALVDPYPYADAGALLAVESPLVVVLDEVQDVQNLGAICRTAECAGADGVVIPERRSAEVTAAACKASAGAVEHLRVARVRNVADFLVDAKRAGCWVFGAATGPRSVDAASVDPRGGCVLVLGTEGKGLRPRVADACDALVALPLRGRTESLNVSAAAAALLYGFLQRRLQG